MSDAWIKEFREKFCVQCGSEVKVWSFDPIELELFISTTREEARAEERERIWKKGIKSINHEQLEIIIRNAKEENETLSYVYVNAIMEGFVNKITEESKENTHE